MAISTTPFDPADFLESEEAIAAYLDDALAGGDAGEIQDASVVAERARERLKASAETHLD